MSKTERLQEVLNVALSRARIGGCVYIHLRACRHPDVDIPIRQWCYPCLCTELAWAEIAELEPKP